MTGIRNLGVNVVWCARLSDRAGVGFQTTGSEAFEVCFVFCRRSTLIELGLLLASQRDEEENQRERNGGVKKVRTGNFDIRRNSMDLSSFHLSIFLSLSKTDRVLWIDGQISRKASISCSFLSMLYQSGIVKWKWPVEFIISPIGYSNSLTLKSKIFNWHLLSVQVVGWWWDCLWVCSSMMASSSKVNWLFKMVLARP